MLVLLVRDDGEVEEPGVLERPAHEPGVHHGAAVVRDGDDARPVHLADLGQPLPGEPERERPDGMDPRAAGQRRTLQDEARDRAAVVHRVGVGHAGDRREAARERRRHPGRDRLLVLLPRLPQVHVHVDQPGQHQQPARVEHRGVVDGRARREARGDPPVVDQQILGPDRAGERIDQAPAGQERPAAHPRTPPRPRTGSVTGSSSTASTALLRATSR